MNQKPAALKVVKRNKLTAEKKFKLVSLKVTEKMC